MRILHVISYFPPAYAFGGGPRVAYLLARELAKRGHEVTVYTTDAKDPYSRIWDEKAPWVEREVDGIRVVYFKNLTMLTVRKLRLFITPALPVFAQKEMKSFDVVHLHDFRTLQNIVISRIAYKHGVPYLLQAHGTIPRVGSWKILKLLYDVMFGYRLLRGASRVIALTSTEAEQYRSRGVPKEKIAIIPNGIDLSEYTSMPSKGSFKKKFSIPEDKKVILYLGRIDWVKGVDILLKAYAYLMEKMDYKNAVLVIVGPDDGYLSEAKALTKSLGISNSTMFIGPLYGINKLAAYIDSDICVLPSRHEGFPVALLEAYACGKPVIASNVESLSELIIDGETGLLFTSENFKQLAEKLIYLLNGEDEAVKIGRKARMLVEEKYSIEKIVHMIEELYMEAIYKNSL